MGNAFFLVCDEQPKVTDELANLNKISRDIRDQTCQLITVPELYYQNTSELRLTSHKIKLINAPLRFTMVVLFVCFLRLLMSFLQVQ